MDSLIATMIVLGKNTMPNRLAEETSPYLVQHANNPVDWYPWGPEAFVRAKQEDKPIFLSIGYSACHWCHVMEHESFEDEEIARQLNQSFVCIKVDREERPDVDQIYMNAVQLLTGRGGWPMSMFLTPELRPFHGGTYWPPQQRMGLPGFQQVLAAVVDAWQNRREQALEQATKLTEHLQGIGANSEPETLATVELINEAIAKLDQSFDYTNGGFGQAPKFPHPMDLQVLMRAWRRNRRDGLLKMVRLNLDKMARGGIYDHLAGGFARYSVDERWLVPHFEKMLYDNALLSEVYTDAFLATGDNQFKRTAKETLDYVANYMTDENGGFHSTEDADSEGEEGKFYVWTPAQIREVLGDTLADRFCYCYDVTESGNFEGKSILNLPKTLEQAAARKDWNLDELETQLVDCRRRLLAVRDQRVRPGKDDKIIASWNGLMIHSFAHAAAVFDCERYLEAATQAARFICSSMMRENGRLWHTWRQGKAKLNAYLDDYACLANSWITLYEASFDETWIDRSMTLAEVIIQQFRDREGGGFFYTSNDHEQLIARNKDVHDSSVPSGSAMAATVLIRLGKLCGRADFLEAARETLDANVNLMRQAPTAAGQLLIALDMYSGPFHEIVILGDRTEMGTAQVLSDLRGRYLPNRVIACRTVADVEDGSVDIDPIFTGKVAGKPIPTVYVCERFACQAPLHGVEPAVRKWADLARMGIP